MWTIILVCALWATRVVAAPYTAPSIYGRATPSCLGNKNPIPCCTGAGVGNCIGDADFIAHTAALQRVDAIVRSDVTEPANYVFAGPPTGAAAAPAWRAFVLADLPETIKTGTGGSFLVMSATENPTTGGCAQWSSGLLTSTGSACGSASGAPPAAQYVTAVADAGLSAEKLLTPGFGIDVTVTGTDAGAATVAWVPDTFNSMTWGTGAAAQVSQSFAVTGNDPGVLYAASTIEFDLNGAGVTNFVLSNAGAGNTELRTISTTGDSQTRWTTGGANWAMGVDADQTHRLAIAAGPTLGTGDVLRITTSGAVSFPDTDGVTMAGPLTMTGEPTGCAEFTAGGVLNGVGVACGTSSGISSLTCGSGLTCTPANPIVPSSGTISLGAVDISANTNLGVSAPITFNTATDTIALTNPLPVANGGTNLTGATDDNVMVGNNTTWQSKPMPTTGTLGCNGTADKLLYRNDTNAFSCGTDLGFTGLTLAGDTGTQPIADTNTITVAGGNGISTVVSATDTATVALRGVQVASVAACAGTASATTAVNAELAAATTAGKAYRLPSGCRVGAGSPGTTGGIAFVIPSGSKILCDDPSAGFFAVHKYCKSGTYPGAACATVGNPSADCPGSGECAYDFGAVPFAQTTGQTYTLLQDAGNGANIEMTNCSVWAYQADPYQHCSNTGRPCRQECTAGGSREGWRCEVDGDCGGGGATCARRADCNAGGGTCTGAPVSMSSVGTAKINVLDFARTINLKLTNVRVYDHFVGDFTIKHGTAGVLEKVDAAAEVTGCTSPLAPSGSACFVGGMFANITPVCCYGAYGFFAVTTNNTQPTNAVTNGIIGLSASSLRTVKARGTTAAFNYSAGGATTTLWDVETAPQQAFGPGNGTAGVLLSGDGTSISDSRIRDGSGTMMPYGIEAGGNVSITNNFISNATIANIHLGGGLGSRIVNNTSTLAPARPTPTSAPTHVLLDSTSGYSGIISENYFQYGCRTAWSGTAAIGLVNTQFINNRIVGAGCAASAMGGAGWQFVNNYVNNSQSNWTGFGLTCDNTCTNRGTICLQDTDCTGCNGSVQKCIPEAIVAYLGNPALAGSTQHQVIANSVIFDGRNASGLQCGDGAGTATNDGAFCQVDLDTCVAGGGTCPAGTPPQTCSGGSQNNKLCCAGSGNNDCTARTKTPYIRIADPGSAITHTEAMIASNAFFGSTSTKDFVVGIDLVSSASLGNITLTRSTIQGNLIENGNATDFTGIKFPTTMGATTGQNVIQGNNMAGLTLKVDGWDGAWGSLSMPLKTAALKADMTTSSAGFTNVVPTTGTAITLAIALDANAAYYFNCEATFRSGSLTNGIGFAVTGPASPTSFSYLTRLPTIAVEAGGGTDSMTEQQGNADDDTPQASIGVGSTSSDYVAAVRGNILTTAAGNLTLRVKSETGSAVTVKKGSNCIVTELPL